jgi:hypothetical protein
MWLAEKVSWKPDPYLLSLTGGRISTARPIPQHFWRPAAHEPGGQSFRAHTVADPDERERAVGKSGSHVEVTPFGRCADWSDARSVSWRSMMGSPADRDAARGEKATARWNGRA